ncbi:MAG: L,D-transpeptidase catalytic domain protein [Candidatus Accumulibacter sp. SK-11]|nr:MAG: L,D-transpeptidase catalytic domain protein [Candidatus Accumulibacter sp. SK-11]
MPAAGRRIRQHTVSTEEGIDEQMMRLYTMAVALFFGLVGSIQAERTPFWGAREPVPFETPADQLRNGEFTWAPQLAPSGPIVVLVSLEEQRAYTYRNGLLIGIASVSTGKPGYETPNGVFQTFLKDKDHHSTKYHNAAMPYTQKITQDGVALHAGGVPGYPESHGCVHLPSEFARLLFDAAPTGMTVVISKAGAAPEEFRHPPFLSPVTDHGELAQQRHLSAEASYRWQPQQSLQGPLSILLSRYDERVLVLRNGVEIGRAKVAFRNPRKPVGSHVFVAKEGGQSSGLFEHQWVGVGLVGHMSDANTRPDPQVVNEITIPADFAALLAPEIRPGTTLMVVDAPVLEHTTGLDMAVLSSFPDH